MQWLESAPGRCALAWEQVRVGEIVADIFGYVAVQVGVVQVDFLAGCRIGGRFCCVAEEAAAGAWQVCALPWELPFACDSVDLLVLPHGLEQAPSPHAVLREAARVLRPEGALVVTGVNPFSLWRANGGAGSVSPLRLREWLSVLGLETAGVEFGCFRPPFRSARWLEWAGWMEPVGGRWWPVGGGVYVLRAVKRVAGMRLIAPQWRRERAGRGKLAPAHLAGRQGAEKRTRSFPE